MNREDVIRMAHEAGLHLATDVHWMPIIGLDYAEKFAAVLLANERKELEAELLKLARGIAAPSQYIQGRWDVVGEFQDVLRARGNKT